MPLTAVAHAKPQAIPYKLWDEHGLYLIVVPGGSPRWRFDDRYAGKRRTVSLDIYPDATLADARGKRDAARRLVAIGEGPSAAMLIEYCLRGRSVRRLRQVPTPLYRNDLRCTFATSALCYDCFDGVRVRIVEQIAAHGFGHADYRFLHF